MTADYLSSAYHAPVVYSQGISGIPSWYWIYIVRATRMTEVNGRRTWRGCGKGFHMTESVELREAVAGLVNDGDTIALEGFTHLIPFAAAHEIMRQKKQGLSLVRMTPDLVYDQMIGMNTASNLIFSWGGNPGVGSLHRFRDAVEHGWPAPLEIEEHSHAGMANRYVAGASNLPFAVLRGYVGTDLPKVTSTIVPITCPFTGEELMAVPALSPDVAIIHAQQADRQGNVALWGISGPPSSRPGTRRAGTSRCQIDSRRPSRPPERNSRSCAACGREPRPRARGRSREAACAITFGTRGIATVVEKVALWRKERK
jgi:acyl CoA:acetate/3-ketoacid CoA transferase alpha subunit